MSDNDSQKKNSSDEAAVAREKAKQYFEKVKKGEGDFDTALRMFRQAAELGDAEAQFELADVFRADNDPATAFDWDIKAAERGYPKAQYNVAVCYRDGIGTSPNPGKQFYWYQKAAENSIAEAKCGLAICYLHGTGTSQDFEKAIYWFQQASNDGHTEAKIRLAGAYTEGIGVPVDKEKGLAFLREAAALGDEKAKKLLRSEEGSGSSGGCYVATCVYGSYDCPEVWTLRRFRDDTLNQSLFGRAFIRIYYVVSPNIVKLFGNARWFNKLCKPVIDRLVTSLRRNGVESSPS